MKHLEFNRCPKQALPNIDWNNEDHVSPLAAHKLRMYLKQHNLQVSGGKEKLVARVLRYVQATLSCNLVTQKIQTTQKTMHNQTLQQWATLSNTVTRYSLSQTLMSNASQYIAVNDSGIFTIFRHNCWEIWRGVRANLPLLRGEVLCNISPCETHFSSPPPSW